MMAQTLRLRIALVYALLVVVALAALGTILLGAEERRRRDAADNLLDAQARLVGEVVAPALRAGGGVEAIDPVAERLGLATGLRVTVIAPDGTVLGDSEADPRALENHAGRPEVQEALRIGSGGDTRRSDSLGRAFTYRAVLIPPPDTSGGAALGVARVAAPRSAIISNRREVALSVAGVAAVTALVAGGLAVLLAGTVTRPLERLGRAAAALARGAFNQRVRVEAEGVREVSDVAVAFNEMAARLEETVDALAHERSRLEALLAAGGDAMIALDRDGIVRYLNPAAESLFGRATGRTFTEAARNHDLTVLVRDALAGGGRERTDVHLQSGGTVAVASARGSAAIDRGDEARDIWLQATASPIAGGGEWAVLIILQDITEVRRAETTRRDFAANVSHELRTPLAGIKAVVETLRDGAIDDPEVAVDFLGRVDAEVDRLVQLVEELLQLARIESGQAELRMTDLSARDLLRGTADRFRPQAERAGIVLAVEAPAELALHGDPDRLGQAVGNLVHNALKFTPAGGRVTLSARALDDAVEITVADTGMGIDPADLSRIFERFYVADRARSRRGTGLGLAIVKHVVRVHGGTVAVRSTLGLGSTFTITLPAARVGAVSVAAR